MHKQARIRLKVRGGGVIEWQAEERERPLRLSHIAFDPANPNKLYVYVQNQTDKDIAIDHLRVNTEIVRGMKTIPAGRRIEAGRKTCVIIHPKTPLPWGSYCGVGVLGAGGERVTAVVRVINYFPIGSWSVDTRPEMFFDSIDLRKPMPDLAHRRSIAQTTVSSAIPGTTHEARPYQAYYDGRDPTCDDDGWRVNTARILRAMAVLGKNDPGTPYYTHICHPTERAFACFGELPDIPFVNPYTILFRPFGPSESARRVRLARRYVDPRPIACISEAFVEGAKCRSLTPDEVSFAMWSEIAEGCKGVRYFTRGGRGRAKGYADMPGVEAQIARDNLKLQLLKHYLRIGDTVDWAKSECEGIVLQGYPLRRQRGGRHSAEPTLSGEERTCVTVGRCGECEHHHTYSKRPTNRAVALHQTRT